MPALEGCVTHGDSPKEALQNAHESATLWLRDALRHGDPIPRPAVSLPGKMTLRMPGSLHRRIAEAAEREGISINQWVISHLGRVA